VATKKVGSIDGEILSKWRWYTRQPLNDARRPDVLQEVELNLRQCSVDATELLQPWLSLFDEALRCLYCLHRYADVLWESSKASPAFPLTVARLVNLLASIRVLITSGLSQSARILTRTTLETTDYGLAVLADDEFAVASFMGDSGDDRFWDKHIGYGKLARRVDELVLSLIDDDFGPNWRDVRRRHKTVLSASVHISEFATAFTTIVPSLAHRGKFAITPFGHHSDTSPDVLDALAKEAYLFVAIVMKLILSDTPPRLFSGDDPDSQARATFLVSAMVLQAVVTNHWGDIAVHQRRRKRRPTSR
jgi:hypothetical protein